MSSKISSKTPKFELLRHQQATKLQMVLHYFRLIWSSIQLLEQLQRPISSQIGSTTPTLQYATPMRGWWGFDGNFSGLWSLRAKWFWNIGGKRNEMKEMIQWWEWNTHKTFPFVPILHPLAPSFPSRKLIHCFLFENRKWDCVGCFQLHPLYFSHLKRLLSSNLKV